MLTHSEIKVNETLTINCLHWDTKTGSNRFMILQQPTGYNEILIPELSFNLPELMRNIDEEDINYLYLKTSLKTWNQNVCQLEQINNAVLGIIGELAEYLESLSGDELLDELGDLIYYRTILKYLVGDNLAYNKVNSNFDGIFKIVGSLADFSKKILYHGKWEIPKTRTKYIEAIAILDNLIINDIDILGATLSEVHTRNVDKLQNRHGSSFNPSHK